VAVTAPTPEPAPAPSSAAAGTAGNVTQQGATTLTLLTYNDVQTAAAENGTFPRMVRLIDRRRQAHDNPVVVAGAGDQVSPHALSPVSQWRTPVEVLNGIEPAADAVGNHDLDYGFDAVPAFANASNYPWLAANVVNESTGEPIAGTQAYEIVERGGVRVAFVGLADGAIKPKTAVDFEDSGVAVRDYREVGPEVAQRLKDEQNVDVVVALAHIGVGDAKELARADGNDAIDVIAVGDDEQYYPPAETSGSVITEAVARAEYVGELNLTVEGGDVTAWNGRLVSTEGVPKDPEASATISEAREVGLNEVVARTEVPLDARFATNYHRESNYGNLITDAMRAESGAQVAITNAGGIRSNRVYGPGNLTVGDVSNVLPFANTLVTVELTGTELKETLASQLVTLESETGQQFGEEISQQVSGVTFEWVPHEDVPPGERIRDVRVNGEPLDPEATYTVTVNSYMAGGGTGYPLAEAPRVSETNKVLATVVVEYLQARGTVAPTVENRMNRVDATVGSTTITVDGQGSTVLRFAAPEDLESANESTFRLVGTGGSVEPDQVNANRNRITVVVDDEDLAEAVGDGGEVDLYGEYQSTEYELVYFDAAVLNADVDARVKPGASRQQAVPGAAPTPAGALAGTP
jgi:2',3'-cyclic-nucleotide 2'-phosphodiesterase (5'-nucleotidase family)